MNLMFNPFAFGTYDWYVAEAKLTPAKAASAILRNVTWRFPISAEAPQPERGYDRS
ncbi:hypothetical protein ACPUER_18045 [Burkholderia sp. DN3021]|uniref:hypothetical protein n=1 Tax=Burkholderia sp. DN3021 TaxID=3410137 RepID=UPI00285C4540|nr:hypothetical protein [Burkholderia ambifaria]